MLSQLALNGLISGSLYALTALGFVLIYATNRFFHFAHGIMFTGGAYLTLAFMSSLRLPLPVAIAMALFGCALLGVLINLAVYEPLKRRGASALVLLLASLGVYVVLQNLISILFGDDTKRIAGNGIRPGMQVFGGRLTGVQLLTIGLALLIVTSVLAALRITRIGLTFRAVADDADLAECRGINRGAVIAGTFALGSVLAGAAGALSALDVGIVPTMGMRALMMGIVAFVIGGAGSPLGVVIGAFMLAMIQQLGVSLIGTEWQDTVAFSTLIIFLLARPHGILGQRLPQA